MLLIHWSDLATAAGAGAVAVLAMTIVQIIKAAAPAIFNRITGGSMVFVVTILIYLYGAWVTSPDADAQLGWIVAWVTCAAAALGVHAIANNGAATFVQGAPKDSGPPPPK